MKRRLTASLLALILLLLCACQGQTQTSSRSKAANANGVISGNDPLTDIFRERFWYSVEPTLAQHGEDYVIEWEDAGMEAHIRFLLDREDGDILHSDVWDIQLLWLNDSADFCVAGLAAGEGVLSKDQSEMSGVVRKDHGMFQTFPAVESLRDLRHFDSLQVFDSRGLVSTGAGGATMALDLSGVEACRNLQVLRIDGVQPVTLEPLADLPLTDLSLTGCEELDLSELAGMESLSVLALSTTGKLSLEPLAELPALKALQIQGSSRIASFAPLAQMKLESLSLLLSEARRDQYDGADYTPFTQMTSLVYLDLTNHVSLDAALCNRILSANPGLKYLDISFTPAADEAEQINTQQLEIYTAMPDH